MLLADEQRIGKAVQDAREFEWQLVAVEQEIECGGVTATYMPVTGCFGEDNGRVGTRVRERPGDRFGWIVPMSDEIVGVMILAVRAAPAVAEHNSIVRKRPVVMFNAA